ncbi:peptidoglycan transglycosylase and transpeptidase FtsI [Geotalea daltonii FRC-32]|uniref:Peptidoglycan transglycosylase and transpeptidase FtsI n=1 Tax=Geotalea daltonii (strain DSM 22248 / JCM 15807 / FRC-32) TaxID=316067 RepID=B9M166_GEODF|nr:penicillin-binding transpeptidase domain-containing protein [Geotalea daltonii]ACM19136.1 peptidoglycan transglycosylase and transpeptidase FtsI [Geotalea daltonii FRC-32]
MNDKKERWTRIRIRIIGAVFVSIFVLIAARAFYLQVVKKESLVKLAEKQHQRIVPLTPVRGAIFDSNNAPLALSIEMDSCFAEPRNVENIPDAAAKLAPLLSMPAEQVEKKLKGSRNFVWLQRRMAPDQAAAIKALALEGIGFVKESKRFYPNSEIAAHVVGFTGMDPEGLEGIELKYDSTILGSTGYLVTERDALGREVYSKGTVVKNPAKGQNVTLTLDKNIQYIAEKELIKAVETNGAKAGIALVMEPATGRILAMANYPNFNPNTFSKYAQQALRNRSIADSFEPGSTFKIFLAATALEQKAIRPGDGFNCENGSYSIGGRTIHDTHKYGYLSIAQILKYSSNIGAAKIGARLGNDKLYAGLTGFGFGEKTGVDLPGESSGTLRNKSQWFGVDLATISFGQGVTATPLQIATGVSAVANGGLLMKPYLVEKISDDNGNVVRSFAPEVKRRVISEETAKTVARMLEGVVAEGGTGVNAAVDGYRSAGKTGTAQKVDHLTRGYSADKRTASYVGFVPLEKPRLTILVVVDEPKTSSYGGIVAAPAFSAIAEQSLCYLKVPTDHALKKKAEQVEVKSAPSVETVDAVVDGGVVAGAAGAIMPNFRGLSMRQALKVMQQRGLNVTLKGSGRAVEQNPMPGSIISGNDRVWVRFVPSA